MARTTKKPVSREKIITVRSKRALRPAQEWVRIGNNMPKRVGDIGFPMVVHPRDEGKKWICIARNLPEIYAVEVAEVK